MIGSPSSLLRAAAAVSLITVACDSTSSRSGDEATAGSPNAGASSESGGSSAKGGSSSQGGGSSNEGGSSSEGGAASSGGASGSEGGGSSNEGGSSSEGGAASSGGASGSEGGVSSSGGASGGEGGAVTQGGASSTEGGSAPVGGTSSVEGAVSAVAVGQDFSCAIVGDVEKCWGYNYAGQIGDNSETDALTPTQAYGLTSGVSAIAGGVTHTCAIVNGSVHCWGSNVYGEIGLGTASSDPVLTPSQVYGLTSGATAVVAGTNHSCAIINGGLKCWGKNSWGQLGTNTTNYNYIANPKQVYGLTAGVTAVAAGPNHTCAIVSGAVKCWGYSYAGQVGTSNDDDTVVTPMQVRGLTAGATAVTCGGSHSCAIVDGAVKCWGDNGGALGNNELVVGGVYLTPVQTYGLTAGATMIAGKYSHTCAVVNGAALCWGGNYDGQLGNNSKSGNAVTIPVQVYGFTSGVTSIATGGSHTCAVVQGDAYCWGWGFYGQLGNYSKGNFDLAVTTPMKVTMP